MDERGKLVRFAKGKRGDGRGKKAAEKEIIVVIERVGGAVEVGHENWMGLGGIRIFRLPGIALRAGKKRRRELTPMGSQNESPSLFSAFFGKNGEAAVFWGADSTEWGLLNPVGIFLRRGNGCNCKGKVDTYFRFALM